MISKGIVSGPRSTSKMNTQLLFPSSKSLKKIMKRFMEVQAKEVISKEDIQELLVKPSMEYSHYMDSVHKFVISMEEFKRCNFTLDVKKAHIFNSREENILTQHEAWRKHFQKKGDKICTIIVKVICKIL